MSDAGTGVTLTVQALDNNHFLAGVPLPPLDHFINSTPDSPGDLRDYSFWSRLPNLDWCPFDVYLREDTRDALNYYLSMDIWNNRLEAFRCIVRRKSPENFGTIFDPMDVHAVFFRILRRKSECYVSVDARVFPSTNINREVSPVGPEIRVLVHYYPS